MAELTGENGINQKERLLGLKYKSPEFIPPLRNVIQLSKSLHDNNLRIIGLPPTDISTNSIRLLDANTYKIFQDIAGHTQETGGGAVRELGLAFVAMQSDNLNLHGEMLAISRHTAHEIGHLASIGIQNVILDEGFTDWLTSNIVNRKFVDQYCNDHLIDLESVNQNRMRYIEQVNPALQGVNLKEDEILYAEKGQRVAAVAYPGSVRLVTNLFMRANPQERGLMLNSYYAGEKESELLGLVEEYYGKRVSELLQSGTQDMSEVLRLSGI